MINLYIHGVKTVSLINSNYTCCMTINKIFSVNCGSALSERLGCLSFHSSSKLDRFGPPNPRPTTYKKPVDWLPFPWHRRPRFCLYLQSGDNIKEVPADPNALKPDFEFSEELKTANETVKQTFSLATASKAERRERMKRDLLARIQRHPFDFDSLEVKIALKTIQIRSLFEHLEYHEYRERRVGRTILPIIIQRRNGLLNKLRNIDEARFNWLLKELDLYFIVPTLGLKTERYCKKWDLRRLTKEHCEKLVASKKQAYHEELKKEQEAFLEEKKQILAWIEKEEEALKSDTDQ